MITADKVALLINMPAAILTIGIQQAGYKKDTFQTAKFRGISNAGLFVYTATYKDEDGDLQECQVFVRYDHVADKVTVDY